MMWRHMSRATLIAAVCLVCALAGGCVERDPTTAMTRHTLVHDGLEREYFVVLPSAYDGERELPVVFFMHGYGGTATGVEAEVTNGLARYAEAYGYVLVLPQSTWFLSDDPPGERWAVTSWNHISDGFDRGPAGTICTADAESYPCPPECGDCGACGWASCHDDVGFLKDLFAEVAGHWRVDRSRWFVAGFSNGAQMANRIACEAAEWITAAALVGGRVEPGFECTPAQALPLLQVNGGADDVVPPDGSASGSGYYYASTAAIARFWADGADCVDERSPWTTPSIPAGAARCTIACAETAAPLVDCLWPDGDHRWPGTAGRRGSDGYCVSERQAASLPEQAICIAPDTSEDVWGSRLLFEFFDTFTGERP